MHARAMLSTPPAAPAFPEDALARCLEGCLDFFQACTSCADACLSEPDPATQRACIRRCQDCADLCAVTVRLLSKQLEACREACRLCAEECEKHAGHMEHCKVCGEVCRACEGACTALLN